MLRCRSLLLLPGYAFAPAASAIAIQPVTVGGTSQCQSDANPTSATVITHSGRVVPGTGPAIPEPGVTLRHGAGLVLVGLRMRRRKR